MSVTTLQLTARDPIVARDGRPFGAGQGNRMRGLGWPLPSVVAGSFRTALVKANPSLDFAADMPQRLMNIEVAGVFPVVKDDKIGVHELYLPAPSDCVWDGEKNKQYAAKPFKIAEGGCDFSRDGLRPVLFSDDPNIADFKPKPVPSWWPVGKLTDWLLGKDVKFNEVFLNAAVQEARDHVCLDTNTGAAAEGQLFTTAGLNLAYLPRYGIDESKPFHERCPEVTLTVRVTITEHGFDHLETLSTWHPLGGERRLVHWQRSDAGDLWECPVDVKAALGTAARVRMVLATPAIFAGGWRPDWLDANTLTGQPAGGGPTLKLVGVSNGRWRAVSGWSLAPPRGPKAIRRMVPAGSVYFFEVTRGEAAALADHWLTPVSDDKQERRDGFGLAVWGIW